MKSKNLFSYNLTVRFLSVLLLIFPVMSLNAQPRADFSGKWSFDVSKSNAGEGNSFGSSDITHIIIQTPLTISIEEIIGTQSLGLNTFALDGKVTTETQGSRLMKKNALWSKDKKTLTLTNIMTIDKIDYRQDDTYKLSDNGRVLTVLSVTRGDNMTTSATLVYNKK
jgi:hypothetical protein